VSYHDSFFEEKKSKLSLAERDRRGNSGGGVAVEIDEFVVDEIT
jgi:hypothetical protein